MFRILIITNIYNNFNIIFDEYCVLIKLNEDGMINYDKFHVLP